jgi:thiol-disulfide isomerase/thioredoxin
MKIVLTCLFLDNKPQGALVESGNPSPANGPEAVRRAMEVLEKTAQAYRGAPALTDVMRLDLKIPGADPLHKEFELGFGSGSDAYARDALRSHTALNGRMYVVSQGVASKYVATSYDGDFQEALERVYGKGQSPPEPIQIAMHAGKDMDRCIDLLRFNLLQKLEITGYENLTDDNGKPIHRITCTAANGDVKIDIDAKANLIRALHLELTPDPARPDAKIRGEARFNPVIKDSPAGVVAFDPSGRIAVKTFKELMPPKLAAGDSAPDFTLSTPAGKSVSLGDLKGSVVVLDFWSNWCTPCRMMLPKLQEFAAWADSSGRPIKVFAVNTMEQGKSPEEKKARALELWKKQKFTLPLLLDSDNSVCMSYTGDLPSMVIIAPDGKIAKVHLGFDANIGETLKAEVTEILQRD